MIPEMRTLTGAVGALVVLAVLPTSAGATDPEPGHGGHVPSPLTRAAAERTAAAVAYQNRPGKIRRGSMRVSCDQRLSFSERKCKLTWERNGKGRINIHAYRTKSDKDLAYIKYWLRTHHEHCGSPGLSCDSIAEGNVKRFRVR